MPKRYISIGLVIYGCACLWSNLYGGKLADKGHGVEPVSHIRPIYCVQAVCLCLLAFASLLAVGATTCCVIRRTLTVAESNRTRQGQLPLSASRRTDQLV